MPWKKKTGEGTKRKFEVIAYYYYLSNVTIERAYRLTLEECHEWLDQHKTWLVPVTGDGVYKNAKLTSYTITEIVETRTVVERKGKNGK